MNLNCECKVTKGAGVNAFTFIHNCSPCKWLASSYDPEIIDTSRLLDDDLARVDPLDDMSRRSALTCPSCKRIVIVEAEWAHEKGESGVGIPDGWHLIGADPCPECGADLDAIVSEQRNGR